MRYHDFIAERFTIVDKTGATVPFSLNTIQKQFLTRDQTGRDVILKARQQGFSSVILGEFTADFLLKRNSVNVVVADIDDNAAGMLMRVKHYLKAYEQRTGVLVPLKYNSKSQLYNEAMDSTYTIGTAKNTEFGRSRTITNLHLSEAAFYPNLESMLAGAGQAVVESGRIVIETTANGFNYFKTFWDNSQRGETTFRPLFYKASDFYPADFLDAKRKELGRLFAQEYPETPQEAFLSSGDSFFNTESLQAHLAGVCKPITEGRIYA